MKNKIISAAKKFDIPLEAATGFYIEIFSSDEILISGDIYIEELEKDYISLKCCNNHISIYGNSLEITLYSVNGIRINGNFKKIEFL